MPLLIISCPRASKLTEEQRSQGLVAPCVKCGHDIVISRGALQVMENVAPNGMALCHECCPLPPPSPEMLEMVKTIIGVLEGGLQRAMEMSKSKGEFEGAMKPSNN
jgi:hypothetical protein